MEVVLAYARMGMFSPQGYYFPKTGQVKLDIQGKRLFSTEGAIPLPAYSLAYVYQQFMKTKEMSVYVDEMDEEYKKMVFHLLSCKNDPDQERAYIKRCQMLCFSHTKYRAFDKFYDEFTLPYARKWCEEQGLEMVEAEIAPAFLTPKYRMEVDENERRALFENEKEKWLNRLSILSPYQEQLEAIAAIQNQADFDWKRLIKPKGREDCWHSCALTLHGLGDEILLGMLYELMEWFQGQRWSWMWVIEHRLRVLPKAEVRAAYRRAIERAKAEKDKGWKENLELFLQRTYLRFQKNRAE